jgi:hypothetical protein
MFGSGLGVVRGVASVITGGHADGAVEADDLAVEHGVLGDVLDEGGAPGRPAQAAGVRGLGAERGLGLLGQRG